MVPEVPPFSADDIMFANTGIMQPRNDYQFHTHSDAARWNGGGHVQPRSSTTSKPRNPRQHSSSTSSGHHSRRTWCRSGRIGRRTQRSCWRRCTSSSVKDLDVGTHYRDATSARRGASVASPPRFADVHPFVVRYLSGAAQAERRGGLVDFVRTSCGVPPTLRSPDAETRPVCRYCRTMDGPRQCELVERRGGEPVRLEQDLAVQLPHHHGCEVHRDSHIFGGAIMLSGVALERGSPLAVKPDAVLAAHRVAIEPGQRGPHDDITRWRQDLECGCALVAVGRRCLRLREPRVPTVRAWPWRAIATSASRRVLADRRPQAIDDPRRGTAPADGGLG